MDDNSFDRDFWEARWSDVVRSHGSDIAARPPSPYLVVTADALAPGRALDAGCGHGSEAIWLAAREWEVTAVDFSATALAQGDSRARTLGPDVAGRIEWVEADLGSWEPELGAYDLLACLYVHMAGSVRETVARLAAGLASNGLLLMVGHLPIDPGTGVETAAAGQVQVTVPVALEVLDTRAWEILTAENRPRSAAGTGSDAVICARRRP